MIVQIYLLVKIMQDGGVFEKPVINKKSLFFPNLLVPYSLRNYTLHLMNGSLQNKSLLKFQSTHLHEWELKGKHYIKVGLHQNICTHS